MLGTGCDKGYEKEKIDYDPNSIIGKWEWLYTLGGIVPSYPGEDESVTLEFTEDSIGIRRVNNNVTFQKEFYISKDTQFWKDAPTGHLFLITHDTLEMWRSDIVFPLLISAYKRIN